MAMNWYSASPARAAQVDRRSTTIPQLQMPRQKIRMKVRPEHMANCQPELRRVIHILLDVALRIDDNRRRAHLIANQIGGVRQTAEIVLFEDHRQLSESSLSVLRCATAPRRVRFGGLCAAHERALYLSRLGDGGLRRDRYGARDRYMEAPTGVWRRCGYA